MELFSIRIQRTFQLVSTGKKRVSISRECSISSCLPGFIESVRCRFCVVRLQSYVKINNYQDIYFAYFMFTALIFYFEILFLSLCGLGDVLKRL